MPPGGQLCLARIRRRGTNGKRNVQTLVEAALAARHRHRAVGTAQAPARDADVDAANREMFDVLQQLMHGDPATIERAVQALSSSRNLEHIADHATNIAEDVIFMIDGEVIRHGRQQPPNH